MSGYETRGGQLFNSACTIDFDRLSAATNYTRDYSRAANTYPHSPSHYTNPWGLYLTKKISPSGRLQYDQYNFNPPAAPKHDMHMPANAQAPLAYTPEFQAYRGRSRPQAAWSNIRLQTAAACRRSISTPSFCTPSTSSAATR